MTAYLFICIASLLAGFGLLKILRAPLPPALAWLIAPGIGLSAWAVYLGVGISLGWTTRQLTPLAWAATALLALIAWPSIRHPQARPALGPVAWAMLLPVLMLAADMWHGLQYYVGSPGGDGWSYVAYGQYLWEVPKGSGGPLPAALACASHLKPHQVHVRRAAGCVLTAVCRRW